MVDCGDGVYRIWYINILIAVLWKNLRRRVRFSKILSLGARKKKLVAEHRCYIYIL
jgi:hypothetical protein